MKKELELQELFALDPQILFFDEPSAGLDPINCQILDELIIDLKNNLGLTFVIVSHDLQSIFSISDHAVFKCFFQNYYGAEKLPICCLRM